MSKPIILVVLIYFYSFLLQCSNNDISLFLVHLEKWNIPVCLVTYNSGCFGSFAFINDKVIFTTEILQDVDKVLLTFFNICINNYYIFTVNPINLFLLEKVLIYSLLRNFIIDFHVWNGYHCIVLIIEDAQVGGSIITVVFYLRKLYSNWLDMMLKILACLVSSNGRD